MVALHLTTCLRCLAATFIAGVSLRAADTTRERIRVHLDAIPAIDCHDHLPAFESLARNVTLSGLWQGYTKALADIAPRPGEPALRWWRRVDPEFQNICTAGFYRYMLPAFRDLYGVDFDQITDAQIEPLDARIRDNYRDSRWLHQIITERANIELMIVDKGAADRMNLTSDYPFAALALNVSVLLDGFHPSSYSKPTDDPYRFAREQGLPVNSLDEYLAVLDRLLAVAKAKGIVCLKSTRARNRTMHFENTPKEKAEAVFGRRTAELTLPDIRAFEDFIMWRLAELAAKHDLPVQIHTGYGGAQFQGASPILLLNLIHGNPNTKFVLLHGGYPWVGETAAVALRHWRNVWIDAVWLPTISPAMARRAFHEWLDVVPSSRILWGADSDNAEQIYASTVATRAVLAEVLAERVAHGDLREDQALRIGQQIMRDNALALFPGLKDRLWKHRAPLAPTGARADGTR